jgi:hypothetical protein
VSYPGYEVRNALIPEFRNAICKQYGFIPFPHQASYWAAADGYVLNERESEGATPTTVQLPDGTPAAWFLTPRPEGPARVLADLGSFKIGKSAGAALFAASFGVVPGAKIKLIGSVYDICTPEFEYILEFLLSDRGMQMKYESLHNRPRDGRLLLKLENGCTFEARSWEKADTLKGKEDDLYLYCEAYQLPGMECFTGFKQNLKAREGFAVFATTPDRPWVEEFHKHGHGDPNFPDWFCQCGTKREVNPLTYDLKDMTKDDPTKGGLMTREMFAIHWLGQFGHYAGSVYDYRRGDRTFDTETHPHLWADPTRPATPDNLKVPSYFIPEAGADYGTYHSALQCVADEDGNLFVLFEFANYHYVSGTPERILEFGLDDFGRNVTRSQERIGVPGKWWYRGDENSQWIAELDHVGIKSISGEPDIERRTEVLRTLLNRGKVFLAPWLSLLPQELEWSHYPPRLSTTGRNRRVKKNDHVLDCLEHIACFRPEARKRKVRGPKTLMELMREGTPNLGATDPHMAGL